MYGGKSELGDRVEQAIKTIGISKEVVEEWLGRPCGCDERQEKLNQLHRWAKRLVQGKTKKAYQYFRNMLRD